MKKGTDDLLELLNIGTIPYSKGESVLDVAMQAGIPFCHECGGNARCSTCRVLVTDGEENLQPPSAKETEMMKKARLTCPVRLACQTRLSGGTVKLSRIFKDETDYQLYLSRKRIHNEQDMGKEMEMALLFLDILNFTKLIRDHLAFDAIHLIRKLFTMFGEEIHRRHGKIVETAGDDLHAAFGFELQELRRSANDALIAGQSILRQLRTLNREYFEEVFQEEIQIGIGHHVGRATVGKLLIEQGSHQIVMGYAVNIAARLEAMTKRLNNNFIISHDALTPGHSRPFAFYLNL